MNKIIIDNKISNNTFNIEDNSFIDINKFNNNIILNIYNSPKIFIYINDSTFNIDINLYSNLNINIFSINSSIKVNTYLEKENICLYYNYRNINKDKNTYLLNIYHNNKNTSSYVTNNGINLLNEKLEYIINGIIKKDSTNCICNQASKIIVMGDNNSVIRPNLIIDNNEIDSSHSSYIGRFKDEDIFYLKSRSLDENTCLMLLINSFMFEKLDILEEEKELIKKEINKIWR